MQNDIFANHLSEIAFFKEEVSKHTQIVKRLILRICPVEGEFISTIGVIRKIPGIDTIGNDKQLDIVK